MDSINVILSLNTHKSPLDCKIRALSPCNTAISYRIIHICICILYFSVHILYPQTVIVNL